MKIYFNTKGFDVLETKHQLDVTENLEEADIAVLGAKTIDFDKAKNLKAIYRFGVGRDNIPDNILNSDTLKVIFPSDATKNVLFEATADFTVFMIFSAYYRRFIGCVDTWKKTTRAMLRGKTLLVLGMGNIGGRVCDKMKSHMNVISYDVLNNTEEDLTQGLKKADIISVHIPLNDKTKGFLDKAKIQQTKDDVIFINSSRGAIFDEDALYEKLNSTDASAFFDVFWQEPYNGTLKELGKNKFFMTPHTSSQTIEYVQAGFDDILTLIQDVEKGT